MTVNIWRFLCVPHLYFIMIAWLKCIKVIALYFFFIYSHALHFAHCFHAEKTVTQIFILPIPCKRAIPPSDTGLTIAMPTASKSECFGYSPNRGTPWSKTAGWSAVTADLQPTWIRSSKGIRMPFSPRNPAVQRAAQSWLKILFM